MRPVLASLLLSLVAACSGSLNVGQATSSGGGSGGVTSCLSYGPGDAHCQGDCGCQSCCTTVPPSTVSSCTSTPASQCLTSGTGTGGAGSSGSGGTAGSSGGVVTSCTLYGPGDPSCVNDCGCQDCNCASDCGCQTCCSFDPPSTIATCNTVPTNQCSGGSTGGSGCTQYPAGATQCATAGACPCEVCCAGAGCGVIAECASSTSGGGTGGGCVDPNADCPLCNNICCTYACCNGACTSICDSSYCGPGGPILQGSSGG